MAIQYAPLFALETQFQTKDGRNNTGGWLKVFLAATDDPATTYSDYNGTRNPEKIVLDDDGRAVVICDKSKAYRLEVYSIDGTLLWTEEPVFCSGTGGGGVSITKVISSDGSISVDRSVDGATTTYDIGLAPNDSDEFLEWIKCSENDCGATWYPVFQDGSMETEAGKGIKVHKGHLYHFTNSFTVDPDGTGVNYDTFRVSMYCGNDIVDEHDFDIDSSLNDPVLCEFSRDVVPSEDTHVYFKLTIPATCKASGEVQCHRIYSGINAVPDTCATKQWVSGSFQPLGGMSAYVPYSSVGNNGMGQVTGINGSAIAGGLDSASVSSIASSVASAYTESAFSSLSSKADISALSAYQPVSAMSGYATTAYVDGMVSGKLDSTAFNSGDFYPTSNPSGFITGVDLGDYATTGFVESAVSGKLDTTAFASASAGFQPTGDYAYNSALTAYIPTSASGAFQPSGDYAFNSAVSTKLDASASGDFVANSAMTSWIPYSALGYSGTAISGINGSSLAGMGGGGVTGDYVEKSATEVAIGPSSTALNTAFAQGYRNSATKDSFAQGYRNSATNESFAQGSSNTASSYSFAQGHNNTATNGSFAQGSFNSANDYSFAKGYSNSANYASFAQGENNSANFYSFAQGLRNSASSDSFAQGIGNSAVYTAAVFGSYNLHGNGYAATGDSAAFAIGDGTAHSARHDLMLVTKNGEITMYSSTADTVGLGLVSSIKAISAAATGGVDSATVSAIASAYTTGKQDTLAFSYNTANQISSINGSALGGMNEAAVSGIASAYAQSAASGKLDSSAFNSADFYSTSNPSGFVGSAYVDSTVSGKLDTTAFNSGDFYSTSNPSGFITGVDLTPYQEKSAMTAYQPSGYYYSASNPSGFITLSDVPAQVNADWNAVSGVAEILNKPTIPSGAQLVPAATSADADKVLTVNAQGTPGWASAQAPISAGNGIDITNNVVSAKVDGTTIDTNASGELTVIGGGSGDGADWTAEQGQPGYIENKPVPKTLKAGAGISIIENQSTITVASSVTVPVRDVTVDGSSVVSNGVAAITTPTVDQTYDASSTNAQSGVAVASGISAAIAAAVIPISVVASLPANPDPNTLYVVTGA